MPLPDPENSAGGLEGGLRINWHNYEQDVEAIALQIDCSGGKTERSD